MTEPFIARISFGEVAEYMFEDVHMHGIRHQDGQSLDRPLMQIREMIRKADVLNMDETLMRMSGKYVWIWVLERLKHTA